MKRLLISLAAMTLAAACFAIRVGPVDNVSNPDSLSVFSGEMVTMTSNVSNGADQVTLEVRDSFGNLHYSADLSPDANGDVSWSWFPLFDGTFRVEAKSYDDGLLMGSESVAFVSAVRPDAAGFVTGGGWFTEVGGRNTFGFVAQVMRNGSIRGNLEFQDHLGLNNWKSTSLDWVYVASPNLAYFSGYATRNGADVYRFFVEVEDWGEPGRADTFTLWVYDNAGNLQFSYSNALTGGNVQIHRR